MQLFHMPCRCYNAPVPPMRPPACYAFGTDIRCGENMYSVPVRSNSYQGIGELKGILRFDGARLTLQYQTADPILAEFRASPVDLDLPAETVVNAQFRSGFLGLAPEIEIRVSDFRHLAKLPVAEAGRLRLRVPRRDRADARKVVEEINAMCAQQRLARLDASISRMAQQAADAAGRSHAARRDE
jgi:hypothetical protein